MGKHFDETTREYKRLLSGLRKDSNVASMTEDIRKLLGTETDPDAQEAKIVDFLKTSYDVAPKRKIIFMRLAEDVVFLTQAFTAVYVNRATIIASYIREVCECFDTWQRNFIYAAYFAIIQASMVGKSRMVLEAAEDVYTIYICLRPESSTGYPPRSALASLLDASDVGSPTADAYSLNMLNFIVACQQVLLDWVTETDDPTPIGWKKFQLGDGLKGTEFAKRVRTVMVERQTWDKAKISKQYREQTEKLDQWNKGPTGHFKFIQKKHESDQSSLGFGKSEIDQFKKFRLVLAIDEARALLFREIELVSLFRLFRRVLKDQIFKDKCALTTTFLDTNAKLSNFSPSNKNDPSLRLLSESSKLFRPFWQIAAWFYPWDGQDATVIQELVTAICEKNEEKSYDAAKKSLFKLGRMQWSSYVDAVDVEESVNVARAKLLNGADLVKSTSLEEVFTDAASLAVISCLTLLPVAPSSSLTSEISSSHMALVVAVDENRESLITSYASEPILVEAAYHALFFNREQAGEVTTERCFEVLGMVLKKLPHLFRRGDTGPGERGEFMMRLYLVLAWGAACVARHKDGTLDFFRPMKVDTYLSHLIKDYSAHQQVQVAHADSVKTEHKMPAEKYSRLSRGLVHVTHWIRPETKKMLTQDFVSMCFARGCGILLPECFEGIDGLVPVYLPDAGRFTFILFQSRNKIDSDTKMKEARNTMNPHLITDLPWKPHIDDPYVLIYQEWRDLRGHSKAKESVTNLRNYTEVPDSLFCV